MKSRQEIKQLAKDAAAHQRGTAILIVFVLFIVSAVMGLIGGLFGAIPFLGWLLYLAFTSFTVVISVNINKSFAMIWDRNTANVGDMFTELGVNFFRKLGGMWWMSLWIFIWSLLLIVPGIIKTIAYSMTPYILANCPNVTALDALDLSKRMTKGHKGKLFVMHLSFIGWILLSGLTFGILYIVYVGPYYFTTEAGFFTELRDLAIENGTIDRAELGIFD